MYNIRTIIRDRPTNKARELKWQNSMKAKGDYQDLVHLDHVVLVIVSWGGWTA
jgi:hypothetical protein